MIGIVELLSDSLPQALPLPMGITSSGKELKITKIV